MTDAEELVEKIEPTIMRLVSDRIKDENKKVTTINQTIYEMTSKMTEWFDIIDCDLAGSQVEIEILKSILVKNIVLMNIKNKDVNIKNSLISLHDEKLQNLEELLIPAHLRLNVIEKMKEWLNVIEHDMTGSETEDKILESLSVRIILLLWVREKTIERIKPITSTEDV